MRLGPALCFLLACACTPPRNLAWEVEFEEVGLRDRVRVLEAEIREGGCAGLAVWSLAFDVESPPGNMGPPDLAPGTYGFVVTARDANCQRYALGCTDIELPQDDGASVTVILSAFPGGEACPADVCTDGECGAFDAGVAGGCPSGRGDCNFDESDGCETVLNTLDACGSCGNTCQLDHATPECAAGQCAVAACDDGWGDCNGVPEDGCETSLRTTSDCGSCGLICDLLNADESCASGSCALGACHPGWGDCDTAISGCETSLIDATHCGTCTTTCSGLTPVCDAAGGTCIAACPSSQCGTSCVDLTSNPQHCGACNMICRSDRAAGACSASTCALGACDADWGDCNVTASDGCETPLVTTANCGSCGTLCGSPTGVLSCATGTCQIDECDPELADCDESTANGCEADLRAATSCGSCTISCSGAMPVCGTSDGIPACLAECVAPLPDQCGDRCFDTANDVENCGSCGRSCSLDNANVRCLDGECRVGTCLTGFGDCDGTSANGCETVLSGDAMNCGLCGRRCMGGVNSIGECVSGECVAVCEPGFGDCDDDPETGCEQSLEALDHCGACDDPCAPANATGACDGTCRIGTCNTGFEDCDRLPSNGCEARTSNDPRNCGGCGIRCSGANRNCCNGVCCA